MAHAQNSRCVSILIPEVLRVHHSQSFGRVYPLDIVLTARSTFQL